MSEKLPNDLAGRLEIVRDWLVDGRIPKGIAFKWQMGVWVGEAIPRIREMDAEDAADAEDPELLAALREGMADKGPLRTLGTEPSK